jgi:hypothetical protein
MPDPFHDLIRRFLIETLYRRPIAGADQKANATWIFTIHHLPGVAVFIFLRLRNVLGQRTETGARLDRAAQRADWGAGQ